MKQHTEKIYKYTQEEVLDALDFPKEQRSKISWITLYASLKTLEITVKEDGK